MSLYQLVSPTSSFFVISIKKNGEFQDSTRQVVVHISELWFQMHFFTNQFLRGKRIVSGNDHDILFRPQEKSCTIYLI